MTFSASWQSQGMSYAVETDGESFRCGIARVGCQVTLHAVTPDTVRVLEIIRGAQAAVVTVEGPLGVVAVSIPNPVFGPLTLA